MREIEQKLGQMMMARLMAFLMERAQNGNFGWDAWLAENGITTTPENNDDYFVVTMTMNGRGRGTTLTTLHVPKEFATKALVLGFLP